MGSLATGSQSEGPTQDKADNRDDERPENRLEECVHVESKAQSLCNPTCQKQHERVDNEDEQTQGDDYQGERQQNQTRAYKSIHCAEDQCHNEQSYTVTQGWMRSGGAEMNPSNDPGRDEQRRRVNDQAKQE